MKIFIATDLHGSAFWAKKTVQKFLETKSDLLVLLGDIYNHGPRNPFPRDYAPMKVAEILNAVADKLLVIKGNCDSEVDQMISQFTFMQENVLFFPTCSGVHRLFFTHGHIHNAQNLPCLSKGDAMFFGHFHKNEISRQNGVVCVNVSSCSLPKDAASYCVVDDTGIFICDFDDKLILSEQF